MTRTHLATFILKKHKPNLLLVHLVDLDEEEHQFGPDSPQAAATLEKIDGHIGELLAADRAAGLADSTDVFIVSDHGFLPVQTEIKPNVLFVKAGLLTADEKGNVTGGRIATVANDGSFFIYWPESEDLRPKVNEALKPLRDQGTAVGRPRPRSFERIGCGACRADGAGSTDGLRFQQRRGWRLAGEGKKYDWDARILAFSP